MFRRRERQAAPAVWRGRAVRLQVASALVLAVLVGALIAAPGLMSSRQVDHVRTTDAEAPTTTTSTSIDWPTGSTSISSSVTGDGAAPGAEASTDAFGMTAGSLNGQGSVPSSAASYSTDSEAAAAISSTPTTAAPDQAPAPSPPPSEPSTTSTTASTATPSTTEAPSSTTTTTTEHRTTTTTDCNGKTDWCGSGGQP